MTHAAASQRQTLCAGQGQGGNRERLAATVLSNAWHDRDLAYNRGRLGTITDSARHTSAVGSSGHAPALKRSRSRILRIDA